jgi:hypothetical protein
VLILCSHEICHTMHHPCAGVSSKTPAEHILKLDLHATNLHSTINTLQAQHPSHESPKKACGWDNSPEPTTKGRAELRQLHHDAGKLRVHRKKHAAVRASMDWAPSLGLNLIPQVKTAAIDAAVS